MGWPVLAVTCSLGCSDELILAPSLGPEHGVVWLALPGAPPCSIGAAVAVPTFGIYEADGTWAVEGHGVAPDLEVIDDPVALWNGQDLQLEAGINAMLEALRTNPPRNPPRPVAPDRSGSGAAPEDQ